MTDIQKLILETVGQNKGILIHQLIEAHSDRFLESVIRAKMQHMIEYGELILNEHMGLELAEKLIVKKEPNELNDEDVCVVCKLNKHELQRPLKNKNVIAPENILLKISVGPTPEYILGEIILCMWCRSSLYAYFRNKDETYNQVLTTLQTAKEQLAVLNKILR